MAAAICHALAHDADFTAGRLQQPQQCFQQGGFAAAVRPDQPDKIGLVYRQVDILQYSLGIVRYPDLFNFDNRLLNLTFFLHYWAFKTSPKVLLTLRKFSNQSSASGEIKITSPPISWAI